MQAQDLVSIPTLTPPLEFDQGGFRVSPPHPYFCEDGAHELFGQHEQYHGVDAQSITGHATTDTTNHRPTDHYPQPSRHSSMLPGQDLVLVNVLNKNKTTGQKTTPTRFSPKTLGLDDFRKIVKSLPRTFIPRADHKFRSTSTLFHVKTRCQMVNSKMR